MYELTGSVASKASLPHCAEADGPPAADSATVECCRCGSYCRVFPCRPTVFALVTPEREEKYGLLLPLSFFINAQRTWICSSFFCFLAWASRVPLRFRAARGGGLCSLETFLGGPVRKPSPLELRVGGSWCH